MDWARIIGLLFTGFAMRAYAAIGALWMAYEAASFIFRAFGMVSKGFAG